MSDTSLNDRLFWPAVAFAVLALGGFGYFAATKMFRSVPTAGGTSQPEPSVKTARVEAPSAAVPSTQAVAAALEASGESTVAAQAEPAEPAAPMAKAEEMEDGPYVLPDRAPVLSADTFKKPAPPKAPAKKPAPKAPVATVASKAPAKQDLTKAPALPLIPTPRYPTYVLNDGRRIPAAKVVDMGEFWGLKTAAGQIVSIRKEEVKTVER